MLLYARRKCKNLVFHARGGLFCMSSVCMQRMVSPCLFYREDFSPYIIRAISSKKQPGRKWKTPIDYPPRAHPRVFYRPTKALYLSEGKSYPDIVYDGRRQQRQVRFTPSPSMKVRYVSCSCSTIDTMSTSSRIQ